MFDISVIIPTINEGKYLEKTLKAVKAQDTKLKYELLICDSGSKDRTLEIAKRYTNKIFNIEKHGIWHGRNEGAKRAKGKIFVFIDADTLIPRNYLNAIYSVMQNQDVVGISCAFNFDKKDRILEFIQNIQNRYLVLKAIDGKGSLLGCNISIKRESFFKVGGFPNAPQEDSAMTKVLEKHGKIMFLPTPKVITSSRRVKKTGVVNTLLYYANLELVSNNKNEALKKISVFKDYKEVR
ncbi:glycosyltransferase [Candidatus Micrarchaeota archaeon]|nr:glycosyltransferase [Candidatus Micrarchaeota archaeon]